MPVAIPNTEPSIVTAGETLAWTRTLPDYPASAWTLKYALQLGTALLSIGATADGDTHVVNVTPATSAAYTPGPWLVTQFVEKIGDATQRHILGHGQLIILPSPLAALGASHASQMLALIEAALLGRIPRGLETTNIDGQEIQRMSIMDLSRLRRVYQSEVASERNKAALAAGLPNRRRILGRFTSERFGCR